MRFEQNRNCWDVIRPKIIFDFLGKIMYNKYRK
nr:MAG TPA: hypothetical protein [Caudoviricetes sp.]